MTQPGIITVEHVYAQAPARVWRALTDPALVARWWVPGDIRAAVRQYIAEVESGVYPGEEHSFH